MDKRVLILAGAGVGVAVAYAAYRAAQDDEAGTDTGGGILETVVDAGGGLMLQLDRAFNSVNWANMRRLIPTIDRVRLENNVRAWMHVVRHKEHYQAIAHTDMAYQQLCGGGTFSDFSDHPRPVLSRPCTLGASGAYQIVIKTWDGIVKETGLIDFSPVNQDRAMLYLTAYRGALEDVRAGRLVDAMRKCKSEWTSLPGAAENLGYAVAEAQNVFVRYGGKLA